MDSLPPRTMTRKCLVCGEEKPHTLNSTRHPEHACLDCIDTLPPIPQGKRRCSRCLAIHDRWHSWCKSCQNAKRRQRYTPAEGHEWNLRYHYDISLEEYNLILFRQAGVCAICKQPETAVGRGGKVKTLAVDHDHENNNVRGLLCSRCNLMLGMIEGDPDRFKAAMKYKKYHLPKK